MTRVDRDSIIRENAFSSTEVYIDLNELEVSPYGQTLRPLVDTLWQLGGESTPFVPDGVWNPIGDYR